jgi:outer membrane protein assembly factor BamD
MNLTRLRASACHSSGWASRSVNSLACRLAILLAALVFVMPACVSQAPAGRVKYSVTAQQNYDKGLKALDKKDWVAAAKYFVFIKSRFAYSKYAALAELRTADAELGAGHYLQSIDNYKVFTKLHPTHEEVQNGYANYRIGLAYSRMLPGDFWLIPPSYEKDQSTAVDAVRELNTFLKKYPKSKFVPEAKKLKYRVAKRLAEHEWYVAKFYWERGKHMGTVLRLRRLLDRYPGVGFDAEALWLLGRAYVREDFPDRARQAWQQLLDQHPRHQRARDARAALAKLPG